MMQGVVLTVRRVVTALLALTIALTCPAPLLAHGVLTHAEPAANSSLGIAPTMLRLTFSEAMEATVSRIVLTGPTGATVSLSPVRHGDSSTMLVTDIVGTLSAGRYTVGWQGAGRDGHPVHGEYQFTIVEGAAGLALEQAHARTMRSRLSRLTRRRHQMVQDSTADARDGSFDTQSPLFAVVRLLQLVAMLAVIGTLGFSLLVLPRTARRGTPAAVVAGAEQVARSIGVAAAAMLCMVALLRLVAQSLALNGANAFDSASVSALLGGTLWGHAWLLQIGAAVAVCGGLLLVPRARVAGFLVAAVSTIAVALAASLSGHAAAAPVQPGIAIFKDVVHVLAIGGWLGTLLLVVTAGIPAVLRLAPGERDTNVATIVNSFSPFALTFAGIAVFAGVSAAWAHLGQASALLSTAYGRVLMIKVGVIVVLLAVGAFNWRWVRPSLGDDESVRRIERSATVELIVAALVLAVTAVLLATPTPSAPEPDARDRVALEWGRAGE